MPGQVRRHADAYRGLGTPPGPRAGPHGRRTGPPSQVGLPSPTGRRGGPQRSSQPAAAAPSGRDPVRAQIGARPARFVDLRPSRRPGRVPPPGDGCLAVPCRHARELNLTPLLSDRVRSAGAIGVGIRPRREVGLAPEVADRVVLVADRAVAVAGRLLETVQAVVDEGLGRRRRATALPVVDQVAPAVVAVVQCQHGAGAGRPDPDAALVQGTEPDPVRCCSMALEEWAGPCTSRPGRQTRGNTV